MLWQPDEPKRDSVVIEITLIVRYKTFDWNPLYHFVDDWVVHHPASFGDVWKANELVQSCLEQADLGYY